MTLECKNTPLCMALLAHVDAGKTTLAERLLYQSGSIRKLGRVDHGDTFLDNDQQERTRGITIFAKQAQILLGEREVTLLDTPGHVDFSAEMERTLQVLDYAVLVISGTDGVQGHVYTLWKLLKHHQVPTFLFVNKMDLAQGRQQDILNQLKEQLADTIVDFTDTQSEDFMENVAVCDETVLESYLESGKVVHHRICSMIAERKVFPCFFGSALKGNGVEYFMDSMAKYIQDKQYSDVFGAKVFKISRDEQGNRLTHMKITGGSLKVKAVLSGTTHYNGKDTQETMWEEKVNQIRIYSGLGFTPVPEVQAGQVCAVTGLTQTYSGQGLGIEQASEQPSLEPVLNYQVILPKECDVYQSFLKLRELEEEDPTLHIVWQEKNSEIHIQLMGAVQIEVLQNVIAERFGMQVEFGTGNIVYKERIASAVEGVGHYEPLKHYAEVHLWMEPGEPGSGMTYDLQCSEDLLSRNWQRLILTHLEERAHKGVLTGSELTDTKITLIAGKAHLKHTEGGDFRQATYRAVRHGLMYAQSELLEPVYSFRLEIPQENVGRAMHDIQRMSGRFETPDTIGDMAVLTGVAPVSTMQGYQMEVTAYTRGLGRLSCTLHGYEPCHNAEEVIEQIGYDPQADLEYTADSVFCGHGAGFVVPWDQVYDYMHLDTEKWMQSEEETLQQGQAFFARQQMRQATDDFIAQEEIDEIFKRTYGSNERHKKGWEGHRRKEKEFYIGQVAHTKPVPQAAAEEYLLVDGYNIIFAWKELQELAEVNIDAARDKLADILCNYQGYRKCHIILVFDAYRVKNHIETIMPYHNIHIVYTKEAETADSYIARTAAHMEGQYKVTVATSDALVQMIIWGKGAVRMSAQGLLEEVERLGEQMRQQFVEEKSSIQNKIDFSQI